MNKQLYIFGGPIFVLLFAIVVTWYIQQNRQPAVTTPVYTDFNISLPNTTGQEVVTPNFLTSESVSSDTQNQGHYFLGNSFTTSATNVGSPTYVITYDSKVGYFNIILLKKPFAVAQNEAGSYLKTLLKLNEVELCSLSYTLSVPGYVDETASGVDYRFSFCPDRILLP